MRIPARPRRRFARSRNQQGSVLIIGMVLLLLMTLVGLITTTATRTDARITSNTLDRAIAFQAAEAALRQAESRLDEPNPESGLSGDAGFYNSDSEPSTDYSTWDDTNSYEHDADIPGTAEDPRYVIDQLALSDILRGYIVVGEVYHSREQNLYRITVVSTGRSSSTQVVLQSFYAPPDT